MAAFAARARELDHVSRQIVPLLPAPLRDHVDFACLHNDRVLLWVASSAWATRARMDQAHILAAVHSLGMAASSVTTKVVPLPAPAAAGAPPSPQRAQGIRAAAKSMADPELRNLFLELAARAEGQAQD